MKKGRMKKERASTQKHYQQKTFRKTNLISDKQHRAFPSGSVVQNAPANAGDWVGKVPWEEEMAPHSSILAWKIPWTEEPGGLQSIGLQSQTRLNTHTHTALTGKTFTYKAATRAQQC